MRRLVLLAALLAAAPALGDDAAAFQQLDVDGDGQVSLSEAAGNGDIVTRFDRADRDRDGKLSRKEFDALRADKLPKKGAKVPTTKAAMASMSAAAGGTAEKKGARKGEKKAAGS
ncbi:MAG: hypothetical protein ACT4P4_26985 [Betaproteobacteria bacterium]